MSENRVRRRLVLVTHKAAIAVGADRWALRPMEVALYWYSLTKFAAWRRTNNAGRPLGPEISGSRKQDPDRWDLYQYTINQYALEHEPITYLEFGVYQGDSLEWWIKHNYHPESTFVGFDTFEGLPEDWREGWATGHFSTAGVIPEISDPRCSIIKGMFQETLQNWLTGRQWSSRLICMMDADLYSSTLYPLILLGPLLKAGDILIFDEFRDARNEFRAFTDWQACIGTKVECVGSVHRCDKIVFMVQ